MSPVSRGDRTTCTRTRRQIPPPPPPLHRWHKETLRQRALIFRRREAAEIETCPGLKACDSRRCKQSAAASERLCSRTSCTHARTDARRWSPCRFQLGYDDTRVRPSSLVRSQSWTSSNEREKNMQLIRRPAVQRSRCRCFGVIWTGLNLGNRENRGLFMHLHILEEKKKATGCFIS